MNGSQLIDQVLAQSIDAGGCVGVGRRQGIGNGDAIDVGYQQERPSDNFGVLTPAHHLRCLHMPLYRPQHRGFALDAAVRCGRNGVLRRGPQHQGAAVGLQQQGQVGIATTERAHDPGARHACLRGDPGRQRLIKRVAAHPGTPKLLSSPPSTGTKASVM